MTPLTRSARVLHCAVLFLSVGLAACGGSGGGAGDSAPTPAPPSVPGVPGAPPSAPTAGDVPTIGACPMFPSTAVFNTRIDDTQKFPAHAQSGTWLAAIGSTRTLHADWGRNEDPQATSTYYGIPWNGVDGTSATTTWPTVSYAIVDPRDGNGAGAPDESDCAVPAAGGAYALTRNCQGVPDANRRFPYPLDNLLKAEFGACNDPGQCGDRHVLVVEQGRCRLWESYFSYKVSGQWYAYSTAAWDLSSLQMRPDGWTSADAAGLPLLPLLARADEAAAGEVRHPLRVTFRDSVLARSHVWPATHHAGGETAGGIPFGALMRLRADYAIPAGWTAQARAVATAMQRYGLYVADIGTDLYVQGDPNAQWSAQSITQLQGLRMGDFEFVDTRAITTDSRFRADSLQAQWP